MEGNFDWKKFEFITTVQTGLIENAIDRSLDNNTFLDPAKLSPAVALYRMSEAFQAADMIPEDIPARRAAWDFTMWLIHGEDEPDVKKPDWLPAEQD